MHTQPYGRHHIRVHLAADHPAVAALEPLSVRMVAHRVGDVIAAVDVVFHRTQRQQIDALLADYPVTKAHSLPHKGL